MDPTMLSHPDVKAITVFLASTSTPERGGLPYLDAVLPAEHRLAATRAVRDLGALPPDAILYLLAQPLLDLASDHLLRRTQLDLCSSLVSERPHDSIVRAAHFSFCPERGMPRAHAKDRALTAAAPVDLRYAARDQELSIRPFTSTHDSGLPASFAEPGRHGVGKVQPSLLRRIVIPANLNAAPNAELLYHRRRARFGTGCNSQHHGKSTDDKRSVHRAVGMGATS